MKEFRFAIMGAGGIANKFSDAVKLIPGAAVTAVASKSTERAEAFAAKNGISHAYGDYEEMLRQERPDCVYIAVLPKDHFRLCMLCMEYDTPVLCEKAMFTGSGEARALFGEAKRRGVFAMEALWSFFMPPLRMVKDWMEEGRVGKVSHVDFSIGFLAEKNPGNRFFDRQLAGGAAYDITVYAYEIVSFLLGQPSDVQVSAMWGETGVDVTDHVVLRYPDCMAILTASIVAPMEERLVIYGSEGRIVVPTPHYGSEAFLYDRKGELVEHFRDQVTQNGFTYEIQETMDCIRGGKLQSKVASWELTTRCAELFDRIERTRELIIFMDSGDTLVDESTEIRDENGVVVDAQLFPGAREALLALYRRGCRIALVADGLEASFDNIFRQHGLEHCFEARAISETVGAEKPNPAMFRSAMEQMGLSEEDKGRIVMIGNNLERDIRGANGMGIHSILAGYSPRYRMAVECPEEQPDYVAETPSRIPDLVDAIREQSILCEVL